MKNFIKTISLIGLIFSLFFTNHLEAKKSIKKSYVTCQLNGQLGNQMHQIATTLAYAWDHGVTPVFPDLKRTDFNIPMNHKRVFFRLDDSFLPRPIKHVFVHRNLFEKKEIPVKPDLELRGFFQTWKYFDCYREKIMKIFALKPQELRQMQSKYAELLNHPCIVGVHVRTFNKEWSKRLPFVGLSYYEKALNFFPQEALFVVFSDRINWCKHHFKKFNRPMIFIEGNDHIEDLFLMSMLKHNIIANSSFSWWAAYLNRNLDKIVIAPSYFGCPTNSLTRKITHANLPEWVTIESNRDHLVDPYPEDMYVYDAVSQSIDTQAKGKIGLSKSLKN